MENESWKRAKSSVERTKNGVAVSNWNFSDGLFEGKQQTVTEEIEALHAQKIRCQGIVEACYDVESESRERTKSSVERTQKGVTISNWNFSVPNVHNQGISNSSMTNIQDGLVEGKKYESVSDELEALHAQKRRMISFISDYQGSVSLNSSQGIVEAFNGTASATGSNSYEKPTQEIFLATGQRLVKVPGDLLVLSDQPSIETVRSTDESIVEISACVDKCPHNAITNHRDQVPTNQLEKKNMEVILIDSDDEIEPPSYRKRENDNNRSLQIVLHETAHEDQVRAPSNGSYHGHMLHQPPGNTTPGSVSNYKNIWQSTIQYQKVSLTNHMERIPPSDLVEESSKTKFSPLMMLRSSPTSLPSHESNSVGNVGSANRKKNKKPGLNDTNFGKSSSISSKELQQESYSPDSQFDNDSETSKNDGLEDLWNEMSLAMECSKSSLLDAPSTVKCEEQDCEHSFMLKDDLGFVCRICGIIGKNIEEIFDYQWTKGSTSIRTYVSESRNLKDIDGSFSFSGSKSLEQDLLSSEIAIHPRHEKQMKLHQLEGFNFLVRNLLSDKPGGCILAHAPGSGKTFMLISFIQSFLGKYPFARPLIIVPKGILSTWKREFKKWQVEEIPLYDFYSVKAESRPQQLDVLKLWIEEKSILFLGYKQFANIVCDYTTNNAADACREGLLKVPTLLIIDEGHTPRNDNTDVLHSLSKVQTPRKVVLSGTLFQNHVKEVFNILNLVRPKFLKTTSARSVVRRILSRVHISSTRKSKIDARASFCELVEETLQNDDNFKRKATVIRDLREMTKEVLHYYKGDFLEELPGLLDFTVLLNLNYTQRAFVKKLGKMDKFRRSSVCSSMYIHPRLSELAEKTGGDKCHIHEEKIDSILEMLDVNDGVKAKFILNILSMSESVGERLLVFSQYLLPLKFLERLLARLKGWRPGREMFTISGDSSPEQRELAMEQINNSPNAKILFGSIKACGEGISLVGASRVIILDVHLNPSVSRQAIGRTFRPGQTKKVHVYRLVAADSFEEADHKTSFRKELTSKMWFEWNEFRGDEEFELEAIDFSESEDAFFENHHLVEDIKCLYRR